MNLYIIGWNLPDEYQLRVLPELKKMTAVYPLLDPQTAWHHKSTSGTLYSASLHSANTSIGPRQYISNSGNQTVFYSGLPVDSSGSFSAHRAEALSSHWDQLTEKLDGMYSIVRATDRPSRLELMTDIIGMEQVFYYNKDDLWLISNSVYLIERLIGRPSLDSLGISLFLSTGWVGDDRTLLSDIRVVPGGQLWTWKDGHNVPSQHCYYKPSRLARQPRKKLTSSYFKKLADDLAQNIRIIGDSFDNITCALTGGRDTRLVTSLLMHAGAEAQHYTIGEQSGTDAKISRQIADTLGLNYKLINISAANVTNNWDSNCRKIVLQGDGMGLVDLIPAMLANASLYSDQLCVDLGGTGGEVARGSGIDDLDSNLDFKFLFNKCDFSEMQHYIARKYVSDFGGFLRREGIELSIGSINRFVTQYSDEGFAPVDIPNAFFLYSRVRRKRGCNKRVQMQYQDFFSPCISRAYIEAAFTMSALQRFAEQLHYYTIKLLSPELHKFPLDKSPWFYPNPLMNLTYVYLREKILKRAYRKISNTMRFRSKANKVSIKKPHGATDMFDQEKWFKTTRKPLREFCLDNSDSITWDFVDRSVFEKITSPASDPAELSKFGSYLSLFHRIETLFYYESIGKHS